jgi:hypothetical protein
VYCRELGLDPSAINDSGVFVPVLPLFDSSSSASSSSSSSSSKIPPVFFNSFLTEQARSLEQKRKELAKVFATNDEIVNLTATQFVVTLIHIVHVCESYSEGVDYIEDMLEKQLVAAIGKVVTPSDFSNYLTFHNRKVYREEFHPKAFSYAIRRPGHYPEVCFSPSSFIISPFIFHCFTIRLIVSPFISLFHSSSFIVSTLLFHILFNSFFYFYYH